MELPRGRGQAEEAAGKGKGGGVGREQAGAVVGPGLPKFTGNFLAEGLGLRSDSGVGSGPQSLCQQF